MSERKKIVYCYTSRVSFVEKDIAVLSEKYDVSEYHFGVKKKWKIPFIMPKQIIVFLYYVAKRRVVISRFSNVHTFVPSLLSKLFPKRFVHLIILGGMESNVVPFIKYGLANRKVVGYMNRVSLKFATLLLPVSRHLIKSDYSFDDRVPSKQGIRHIYPTVKTDYLEIFNGFDEKRFNVQKKERTPKSFVTISQGLESERTRILKGISLLFETARLLPDYSFTIIGSKEVEEDIPENIHLVSFVPNDELVNYLNSFEYYVQLSLSEGFPNALCEAMLCGCIPIVSRVGIMPEIIDSHGFVLDKNNALELRDLILSLPVHTLEDRINVRCHIINHYSLEKRKQKFQEIVDSYYSKIRRDLSDSK